jgi:hypothetical protein
MTNPLLNVIEPIAKLNDQLQELRRPTDPLGSILRVADVRVVNVTLSLSTDGTLRAELHRSAGMWYGCTVTIRPESVEAVEHVSASHGGPAEPSTELLVECFTRIAAAITELRAALNVRRH